MKMLDDGGIYRGMKDAVARQVDYFYHRKRELRTWNEWMTDARLNGTNSTNEEMQITLEPLHSVTRKGKRRRASESWSWDPTMNTNQPLYGFGESESGAALVAWIMAFVSSSSRCASVSPSMMEPLWHCAACFHLEEEYQSAQNVNKTWKVRHKLTNKFL